MSELKKLKYPIGKFTAPENISDNDIGSYINTIQCFPEKLRKEAKDLSDAQLDTPYRPDGWTISIVQTVT